MVHQRQMKGGDVTPEKIYYVEIEVQIEYTFYKYTYTLYFDSEKARNRFIRAFNAECYSLRRIKSRGEAYWNSKGMLSP